MSSINNTISSNSIFTTHLQMKYVEVILAISQIFLPGHLGDEHPFNDNTDQEFGDVSLYRSSQKNSQESITTSSPNWSENSKSSTPKDDIHVMPTVPPPLRLPHSSPQIKTPSETGFIGRARQPCSLAPPDAKVSHVELTEYEAYKYEVSSSISRRKRSQEYPKPYLNTISHQQFFTEYPEGFFQTTYANDIMSETLNHPPNGNIARILDFHERANTVQSMSGTTDLYHEPTISTTSWDTAAGSDRSSTRDSIASVGRNPATTTPETVINFCDDDLPVNGISLEGCPSCQGRCGEVGTVSLAKVLCSCDRACLVYLDCCPDFELLCPQQYTQGLILSNSMSGSWDSKCLTFDRYDGRKISHLFISECNGTAYELVVTRGVPTASGGVPVEDMTTGLFFINYDCAKCHGATNLRPMQIMLHYDLQQCDLSQEDPIKRHPNVNTRPRHNETQFREPQIDRESADTGIRKTTAGMENPGGTMPGEGRETVIPLLISPGAPKLRYAFVGKPTRRCYDGMIDRCSETCSNNKLIELCMKSGFMYTTINEYRFATFKNVYCAICFTESDRFTCGNLDYIDDTKDKPEIYAFSLSVLFDFKSRPRIGSVGIICDKDQVILPNILACGDLVCSKGYIRQNDTCVPLKTPEILSWEFVYLVAIKMSSGCTLCENNTMRNFNDTLSHVTNQLFAIVQNVSQNVSMASVKISCSCINLLQTNISIQTVPPHDDHSLIAKVTEKLNVEGTVMVLNSLLTYLIEVNSTASFSQITFLAFNSSPVSYEYDHLCLGYIIPDKDFLVEGTELILRAGGKTCQEDEYILKNGSAFVCYKTIRPNSHDPASAALAILTIVLSALSFSCICVRIILQFTTDKYKSIANRMQFHFSLALCLSTGLLLISPLLTSNRKTCSILAATKYFSFLATFSWMTCISGDTWWVFQKAELCIKDNPGRSIVKQSLVCWLLPLLVSILVLGLDYFPISFEYKPQFGGWACWITNMSGILIYFVAPVSILITINMSFFILTSRSLRKTFQGSNKVRQIADKNKEFRVYLKLFILMGLTWAIGIIAPWTDTSAVWFLFTIFNASQGMFIFLAFVFDYRILRLLTRKCCTRSEPCVTSETGEENINDSRATGTTQITTVVEAGRT